MNHASEYDHNSDKTALKTKSRKKNKEKEEKKKGCIEIIE